MKRIFTITLIILCLLLIPKVKASSCDDADIVRLTKIATNVNFSYTYQEYKDSVLFTINLSNMNSEIYLKDFEHNKTYRYNGEIVNHATGYKDNQTVRFDIYSTKCKELLFTNYVNLPPYNSYYDDPLCEGISTYYLCQKWSYVSLNYNGFKAKIEEYKKEINNPTNPTEEENILFWYDYLFAFFLKYYFWILTSIIIICSSLMLYLGGKNKFNFKIKKR